MILNSKTTGRMQQSLNNFTLSSGDW